MKISQELLDEYVSTIVGDDVLPLMGILINKSNLSEFKLAEMLNVTVNQTRNMLYRLNEQNLVAFIRKKDKKKGWYIYYWSHNKQNIENSITRFISKQLEDFQLRLKREESSVFYVCPSGCVRLGMEAAMECEFKCQECGALLKEQNNEKTIANIRKRIGELEAELQSTKEIVKRPRPIMKLPEKNIQKKKAQKKTSVIKKVKKIIPKKTFSKKKKR